MKIILPSYEILTPISEGGIDELKKIEEAGRTCYKSEDKISADGESAKKFCSMLIKNGHEAMIEHSQLSVRFICDRGISHEIVRHRISSFAQESTRYVNYGSSKKAPDGIIFIKPCYLDEKTEAYRSWKTAMEDAEVWYLQMIKLGCKPQEARAVLPMSTKTELVMTANYREWRNFFKLRTDKAAHPQIREIAIPLLHELQKRIPVIFDDIKVDGAVG